MANNHCVNGIVCVINPTTHIMKRIISKQSHTNQQKLADLLSHTKLNNGCMEWTRCYNTDGYPRMGGNVKVHRLVNSLYTGADIKGLVIRHTCDNIKCINPVHLLPGTQHDNINDMVVRDRYYRVVTEEVVFKVKKLLGMGFLSHRDIANLVGIDPRRISDINCNKYNDKAKLIRR